MAKTSIAKVIVGLGFLLTWAIQSAERPKIPQPGEIVPDFSFLDTDKIRRDFSDLPPREAYVFFFGLLDCPLAGRLAPTLAELSREFRDRGVEFVGLYGRPDQSILEVASYRINMNLPFTVGKDIPEFDLRNPENQKFAGQILGVSRSPHVVVLDKNRRLIYRGRVDGRLGVMGSRASAVGTEGELHRALRLLTAGTPELRETPTEGCFLSFDLPELPDGKNLTFYKDIQPLLKRACWDCHRDDGEAPFSLVTYDDVKNHAVTMVSVTRAEVMPPAFSQKKVYRFINHREISQDEKSLLEAWVRAGVKEGDPKDSTVTPPEERTEWRIGTPDLILTFPQDHLVRAKADEKYMHAVLPYIFWRDTWVESIEIVPTNRRVTHHANLLYWNAGEQWRTGAGASVDTFLTGYVPGGTPMETRKVGEGIAALIPAFSVLGFQIHYVPTGRDERANLKVGIRFAKQTVHKKLYPLMFSSPDFQVPARNGDVRIPSKQTAKHDMDVVAFFPHMHLRGKAMWLDVNEGGKEKRLLEVPAYSFSWQMGYLIRPGTVRIPEGTLMTYHALYNNSDMNTFNPNPNVQPINGERTEDEMLMGFLFYLRPEERLNLNINPATGNVR